MMMKKLLTIILLTVVFSAYGQKNTMTVYMKDGTKTSFSLENIDSIALENVQSSILEPEIVVPVENYEPQMYASCYSTFVCINQDNSDPAKDFIRCLWEITELTSDEAICAWSDSGIAELNFNRYSATNPVINNLFQHLYSSITRCNYYLGRYGLDSQFCNKTHYAEVRFLRALEYFYLLDLWGNVPLVTDIITDPSYTPQQIERSQLFSWIEQELQEAIPYLREPQFLRSGEEGYGSVDRDAAYLLLARLYLNAEVYTGTANWGDAYEYARKVIEGPHKLFTTDAYSQFSAYQQLFMGDNGENGASVEALFPILQGKDITRNWGISTFLIASTWDNDMGKSDDAGFYSLWGGNRARKALVSKFITEDQHRNNTISENVKLASDDRFLFYSKDHSFDVLDPSNPYNGYSVGKFRNTYSNGGTRDETCIDMDFFLMRSAEAYLIAAEADARQNGGQTTNYGSHCINALRQRANTTTKESYTLDEILDERSRELYFECHRRSDLIRYGYYDTSKYLWDWKGGVFTGSPFPPYYQLLPIPLWMIQASPGIEQNPGY